MAFDFRLSSPARRGMIPAVPLGKNSLEQFNLGFLLS